VLPLHRSEHKPIFAPRLLTMRATYADRYEEGDDAWIEAEVLPAAHSDWVRDVAWAPTVGDSTETIASCSQDKKVIVWTRGDGGWTVKTILMPCIVWSVSWSVTGSILAAAGGDNQVTLWKEDTLGEWKQIGQLSEDATPEPASY